MELFENKVGRPSNETIKKRRIFYVCISLVCMIVIIGGTFLLSRSNVNDLKGAVVKAKCSISREGDTFKWYCTSGYVKNVFVYSTNDEKENEKLLTKYSDMSYIKSNKITINNFFKGYRVVFKLSDGNTKEILNETGKEGSKKPKVVSKPDPEVFYNWDSKDKNVFQWYSYGTKAKSYKIYLLDGKKKKLVRNKNIKSSQSHMGALNIGELKEDNEYQIQITFKKGARTYKETKTVSKKGPEILTVCSIDESANAKKCFKNIDYDKYYDIDTFVIEKEDNEAKDVKTTKNVKLTTTTSNKNSKNTTTKQSDSKKDEEDSKVTTKNNSKYLYLRKLNGDVYDFKTKEWYEPNREEYTLFKENKIRFSDYNPGVDYIYIVFK